MKLHKWMLSVGAWLCVLAMAWRLMLQQRSTSPTRPIRLIRWTRRAEDLPFLDPLTSLLLPMEVAVSLVQVQLQIALLKVRK